MKRLRQALSLILIGGMFIVCGSLPASVLHSGDRYPLLTVGAKNVVIGISVGNEQNASVIVRIKEIRRDYETKGFFRIGLLPIVVAQGVAIEINQATSVSDCLTRCEEFLFSKNVNRLELHDLHLLIHGSTPAQLSCEAAKPSTGGCLELLGPVIFELGTNRVEAAHAFLQMKGSGVGVLTMSKPAWKTSLAKGPLDPREAP